MDMGIQKARCDILAVCFNYPRVFPNAMCCITDQGNTSFCNGYIDPFLDFCRADINQLRIPDDKLGLLNAHCNFCHGPCDFIQWFFAEFVQHRFSPNIRLKQW